MQSLSKISVKKAKKIRKAPPEFQAQMREVSMIVKELNKISGATRGKLYRALSKHYKVGGMGWDYFEKIYKGDLRPGPYIAFLRAIVEALADLDGSIPERRAAQVRYYTQRLKIESTRPYMFTTADPSTLAELLAKLDVPRDPFFEKAEFFKFNKNRKCIDTIIQLDHLCGAAGLPADLISARISTEAPSLPQYVLDRALVEQRELKAKDEEDGFKAGLQSWIQLPDSAQKGRLTLTLAQTRYSTNLATRACREQIYQDFYEKRVRAFDDRLYDGIGVSPLRLSLNFHCDGMVIAGDKIMLSQRGERTDDNPLVWQASFGQGMKWDEDRDKQGRLHPLRTVWKAMGHELGLHEDWIKENIWSGANVTFLEMGFTLRNFIAVLFSVIEIPDLDPKKAQERAENFRGDKETRHFDFLDCNVEKCVTGIVEGQVDGKKINDCSRYNLLLVGLRRFNSDMYRELERRIRR